MGVSPLRREPMAMGMEAMHGEGFALVGGFRSGNSPPGMTRCRYMIIDMDIYIETKDSDAAKVGTTDLFIGPNNAILGMVGIKLNPKNRKAGIGSAIVKSLVATAPGDFAVYDIKKSAVGFWRKMGAEFKGLDGVIRK
jgi:hypothetical protein